jgi:hypothetical protein
MYSRSIPDSAVLDQEQAVDGLDLPDGQLYRASPADYWIPAEGAAGLGTRPDPMGGTITCQTLHVSRREPPKTWPGPCTCRPARRSA